MTGEAVITGAGRLPAKYVIHTVEPVFVCFDEENEYLMWQQLKNSSN